MGSLARRLLGSSDADRKRLERALHDGAQQRLVVASTTLGLALRRLEDGEPGARELVEEAAAELRRGSEELRVLARDIYPAVLAERGLASAVHDLARAAPGAVEIGGADDRSLPEAVAVTAYRLLEAVLGGVGEDDHATVSVLADETELVILVEGAGLGGEPLEHMRARVDALDGSLEISSAPAVRAVLPLDA